MSKHTVSIDINGTTVTKEVDSRMLLVHFIREELQMTGTHIGCDTSSCGACTILMDGRSVKSCTLYTVQANGKSVKTIEGMEEGGALHPPPRRISRGAWSTVRVLYPGYDHEGSGTAGEKSESQ